MLDISRWAGDGVGAVPSIIKSIQLIDTGGLTFPVTIDEVNPDYSIVIPANVWRTHEAFFAGFYFASGTSVALVADNTFAYGTITVIEFEPSWVKFKQAGVVTAADTTTFGPIALTQEVNPSKCLLFAYSYFESDDRFYGNIRPAALAGNQITLTGYVYTAYYNKIGYQLIELR